MAYFTDARPSLSMRYSVAPCPGPGPFFGTLLLIFSPMQLNNLLRLRDYAKAPFLLAAMAIALFLLRPTLSRSGLIGWAAAAGLVLGVGYGFRQDTFIAMPALTIVLLLFAGQARELGWRARLAGVAACWTLFCAASFPALREMGESCKYHYLVQGLCGIYDGRLGAGEAPYAVVHRYFDVESTDVFQAYTKQREGKFRALELFTKDYEDVASQFDFAPGWDFEVPRTGSGTTRVFFPVYASYRPATQSTCETSSYFRGLAMSPVDRARLIGVAEVREAERFPLWLTATLAPGWETQPLYQQRTR